MKNNDLELKKKIVELGPWFHNIKLGNEETNPKKSNYPEDWWKTLEPYVPDDLSGKTVLDLGCNAGYYSVKMKKRGANVLGVDMNERYINQAKFVSDFFGLQIDFQLENIYNFVLKNTKKFDYVIFLGIFYHLRHPLVVLDKLAEITNEKLYFHTFIRGSKPVGDTNSMFPFHRKKLVVKDDYPADENRVFTHPDFPKAFFIENKCRGDPSYWWVLNEPGVYSVLSSGFTNTISIGKNFFVCETDPNRPDHSRDSISI